MAPGVFESDQDSESSDDDFQPVTDRYGQPEFSIPMKHNADSPDDGFSTPQDETCSISSQATTSSYSTHSSSGYASGSGSLPMPSFDCMGMYSNQRSHNDRATSSFKRPFSDNEEEEEEGVGNKSPEETETTRKRKKKQKKYHYDRFAQKAEPDFNYDQKALNMMEKMGFQKGKGLGINEQGRVKPIELSTQRGRRGLGQKLKGLEPENLVWDSTQEVVEVKEVPKWLFCNMPELRSEEMVGWSKEGAKVLEMESFTDFVDPELLNGILNKKSVFDNLESKELLEAVRRSNPFEAIGKGIFQNRAAMKMANIDKVFSFMFTNPVNQVDNPIIGENDLLYFADVCAGPGGFSEYVLYRKQWQAKGIGFTLKGDNDFKLDKFLAGTPESFEPYYGAKDDGNVYDPENIQSLTSFVMKKTDNLGVHFMMADGGFSVEGKENIQELLSKRLYLCQCLVALSIVRTGGHFVCKLFDLFSPFSVGIVYLMYRSFDSICIHKPNTSRPANSERYIICKGKRKDCDAIRDYMFKLNERFETLGEHSKIDIVEVVPMSELTALDSDFFNYIVESNNTLGERQLLNLVKVIHYCKDEKLTEPKQYEMKVQCLNYWNVEDFTRKKDNKMPEELASQILNETSLEFATVPAQELKTEDKLKTLFPSVLDWTCIPIGDHTKCNFYIGCGTTVYVLRKNGKSWNMLDNKIQLNLSPGTLVYGEIIEEVSGTYRAQSRMKVFHIIDAFSLGKKYIANRSFSTRIRLCKLYARALHKTWVSHGSCMQPAFPIPIRANNYYQLKHFSKMMNGLDKRINKSRDVEILFGVEDDRTNNPSFSENYYFPMKGILFYKLTKYPWTVNWSKSTQKMYYYNIVNKNSVFSEPSDIATCPIECYKNRRLWSWGCGVGILGEGPEENVLHITDFRQFIEDARKMMTVV